MGLDDSSASGFVGGVDTDNGASLDGRYISDDVSVSIGEDVSIVGSSEASTDGAGGDATIVCSSCGRAVSSVGEELLTGCFFIPVGDSDADASVPVGSDTGAGSDTEAFVGEVVDVDFFSADDACPVAFFFMMRITSSSMGTLNRGASFPGLSLPS